MKLFNALIRRITLLRLLNNLNEKIFHYTIISTVFRINIVFALILNHWINNITKLKFLFHSTKIANAAQKRISQSRVHRDLPGKRIE